MKSSRSGSVISQKVDPDADLNPIKFEATEVVFKIHLKISTKVEIFLDIKTFLKKC